MAENSKLLFALKILVVLLLLWLVFIISPRGRILSINQVFLYLSLGIEVIIMGFLSFRSWGGIRICGYCHIIWTLCFTVYMIWVLFDTIVQTTCTNCIDLEEQLYVIIQSTITITWMMVLSFLWGYILVQNITFQSSIEVVEENEVTEPLPLYIKSELPTYDDTISSSTHR
jgi:hypothetical protein